MVKGKWGAVQKRSHDLTNALISLLDKGWREPRLAYFLRDSNGCFQKVLDVTAEKVSLKYKNNLKTRASIKTLYHRLLSERYSSQENSQTSVMTVESASAEDPLEKTINDTPESLVDAGGIHVKMNWTRNAVMLLIQLWEGHPSLYTAQHHYYYSSFYELLTEMRVELPTITAHDIEDKMRELRVQYAEELRKMEVCLERNEIFHTKFDYYKNLQFLNKNMRLENIANNSFLESTVLSDNINLAPTSPSTISAEEMDISTPTSIMPRNARQMALREVNQVTNYTSEVQCFGEFVKSEMVAVKNDTLRIELKQKICNLLFEYNLKQIEQKEK